MELMRFKKTKQIRLTGQKKKDLQFAVLERDNFTCRQCDEWTQSPPHHIKKISQGGDDIMENMVTLCITCHDLFPNWKRRVEWHENSSV